MLQENQSCYILFKINVNSLKTITDECITKLKELNTYNGDASLKTSANKIILFYKKEANEYFPSFIDFFIKKDNFEKVKKTFEAKNEKSRTQEDVDLFNNAVEEYNNASQLFNKTNQTANNQRTENLNIWNNKVTAFFEKHAK